MLKVGILGFGMMGRAHRSNYMKLEQAGFPIKLVAICDIDEGKFKGQFAGGNFAESGIDHDFSAYKLFTDVEDFLNEDFDIVDIVLPTYLHDEMSIKAMNKGFHVLCEKPMALSSVKGAAMLHTAIATGKKLMVAHCLRFWPEYEYLKESLDNGRYGKVLAAYFYRGGAAPLWSYENWMLDPDKSGGALLDLHIHDVDMVNWLFGMPQAVSAVSCQVLNKSSYDIISAHFMYPDGKVVNAQTDLSLSGQTPFEMTYRVHFERATLLFEKGVLTVYPEEGEAWVLDNHGEDGYYREIKYFAEAIMQDKAVETCKPEDTIQTIRIIEAERASADSAGAIITL